MSKRLGPQPPWDDAEWVEEGKRMADDIVDAAKRKMKGETTMHYRNGREAKNGDKIVMIGGFGGNDAQIVALGVLFDAKPGNGYCNGAIAPTHGPTAACLCDCLHVDDLAELLKEKGLDKRPAGK